MLFLSLMRWITKTRHISGLALQPNFRTLSGPLVKKFAHRWNRLTPYKQQIAQHTCDLT